MLLKQIMMTDKHIKAHELMKFLPDEIGKESGKNQICS
jgi:hypothetical protein